MFVQPTVKLVFSFKYVLSKSKDYMCADSVNGLPPDSTVYGLSLLGLVLCQTRCVCERRVHSRAWEQKTK